MNKLLITGAKGQLGNELIRQNSNYKLLALGRNELDITDICAVNQCINSFHPDVVVNAAAYTDVDMAESNVEKAFAVNCDGATNIAMACNLRNIPLIQISTDYVFDGSKGNDYNENDQVAPLGVYGESKLAGEQAVIENCSCYVILRTSWIFSVYGNNFVKTIVRLCKNKDSISVVDDQKGRPTSATELAFAIYVVLERGINEDSCAIYHFCQPDATTWFDFATVILSEAKEQGLSLKASKINAITTKEYPTPAKRPKNSTLNCSKFEKNFHFKITPWSVSLRHVIKELINS